MIQHHFTVIISNISNYLPPNGSDALWLASKGRYGLFADSR